MRDFLLKCFFQTLMVFLGLSAGYVLSVLIESLVLSGWDTRSFLLVLFELSVLWTTYQFFTREVTAAAKGKIVALSGIHLIVFIPLFMAIGCSGDGCNATGVFIFFVFPPGAVLSIIGLIYWWMNREKRVTR